MKQEVEIRTGRREQDGLICLSVFTDELMALTLEGHGERTPTLLLTLEQARKLRDALSELTRQMEGHLLNEEQAENWRGEERRRLAS